MEKDGNKTLDEKKNDVSCMYSLLLFPIIMIFQRVFGLPGFSETIKVGDLCFG